MILRVIAACAAFLCVVPGFAAAHVGLVQGEALPGQVWESGFKIGHGCDKASTIRVEANFPAAFSAIKAVAAPGWTVDVKGQTIVWSGGVLPDGERAAFSFSTLLAPDAKLGGLAIPVVQICEKGEHRWTEIAAAGQDAHALKAPAPVVQIVQHLSIAVQEPWVRATPKGSRVAGGFGVVVNPGQADRLVSASFPTVTSRTEIHEMAMANGMMTMRALPKGIEIPAAGKVEFKPGSFHLMLMELKEPLVAGQMLEGILVFEKAGPVRVNFPVVAIGAPGPDAHHKH